MYKYLFYSFFQIPFAIVKPLGADGNEQLQLQTSFYVTDDEKTLADVVTEADVRKGIIVKNSSLDMYVQRRGKPENLSARKK